MCWNHEAIGSYSLGWSLQWGNNLGSVTSPTEANIQLLLTLRTWVYGLVVWIHAALPSTVWALYIPCAEKILLIYRNTQFLGQQLKTFVLQFSPVHLILHFWGRGFFLVIASLLAHVDTDHKSAGTEPKTATAHLFPSSESTTAIFWDFSSCQCPNSGSSMTACPPCC